MNDEKRDFKQIIKCDYSFEKLKNFIIQCKMEYSYCSDLIVYAVSFFGQFLTLLCRIVLVKFFDIEKIKLQRDIRIFSIRKCVRS